MNKTKRNVTKDSSASACNDLLDDATPKRMSTKQVSKATKDFRDFFGFDLTDTTNLKTKKDCKARLMAHRSWLEDACNDALRDIDQRVRDLGLQWVGI
jgi:hypothetical protein